MQKKICPGCSEEFDNTKLRGVCDRCYRLGMTKEKALLIKPAAKQPEGFYAKSLADLVAGELCPTCGKRVGLTAAERQRRYRERKKNG